MISTSSILLIYEYDQNAACISGYCIEQRSAYESDAGIKKESDWLETTLALFHPSSGAKTSVANNVHIIQVFHKFLNRAVAQNDSLRKII